MGFAKIILGALAGILAYAVGSSLLNAWSGVIGALLIGLGPGNRRPLAASGRVLAR